MKYAVFYTLSFCENIEANSLDDLQNKLDLVVPVDAEIYGYEVDGEFVDWDGSEW